MQVDPANVVPLVEMLMISKYVERIADHATNVAEWVIYYLQGRMVIHT
jgi:phosphate transport system protein